MKDRPKIGQIALTINGECCPTGESKSEQFSFTQRVFELAPGQAVNVRGVSQHPDLESVFSAAMTWLEEIAVKCGLELQR